MTGIPRRLAARVFGLFLGVDATLFTISVCDCLRLIVLKWRFILRLYQSARTLSGLTILTSVGTLEICHS